MRHVERARFLAAVGIVALLCHVNAYGQGATQASITGVVRDASGAVLPGVTVEASSPVLIEKSRTAITNGTGATRWLASFRVRIASPIPSQGSARCVVKASSFPGR